MDDDRFAAGVLLQKASTARVPVRVVYITDGDDNPWPQRVLEKRWRLRATDRARWGKRRRREAVAALELLGLRAADARFLGLPDQGLTRALLHDCENTSARIRRMIADWKPTHLLFPSQLDTHPDHSAAALLVRFAFERVPFPKGECALLRYLVHGKCAVSSARAVTLRQSERETAVKRHAIAQHRTQVKFSRRRFMSYAGRPECFLTSSVEGGITLSGAIRGALRTRDELRLIFRFRMKPIGSERPTLYVLGRDRAGAPLTVCTRLPTRAAQVQVTACATGRRLAIASYRGSSFQGLLTFPVRLFGDDDPVFAKISRHRWFFDEAGWTEIAPLFASRGPVNVGAVEQLVSA
ncbi:MAG: PIG-L deacetylase family protein [Chthoniobacterales bacterium]